MKTFPQTFPNDLITHVQSMSDGTALLSHSTQQLVNLQGKNRLFLHVCTCNGHEWSYINPICICAMYLSLEPLQAATGSLPAFWIKDIYTSNTLFTTKKR